MALARPALRREKGLLFWKLCGAGSGHGFDFRPNGRQWAILAAWPDLPTARAGIQRPTWARWRAHAVETYTVFLNPVASRGAWAGVNPFLPDPAPPGPGPYAALTRATVKLRHLPAFWARVPDVNARIGADPAVAFKIGIGEIPLLHQVTFSVWPDLAAMAEFARKDGPHARAIRAVREGGWFAEELYARFQVLATDGTWGNADPLSAHLTPERKAA